MFASQVFLMNSIHTNIFEQFEALGASALKKQRKCDHTQTEIITTLRTLKGDAIVIFDTETSGFGGVVIQLAFCVVRRSDAASMCTYNRYWKLPPGKHIDARAEQVHKISEAFLIQNGYSAEAELCFFHDILKERADMCTGDKFLLVAHNLKFDVAHIIRTAMAHGRPELCPPHLFIGRELCTMSASKMPCKNKLGHPKKPRNDEQYAFFFGVLPDCTLHDALSDVFVTHKCYEEGRLRGWW